jgi:multidrug efflux pump subunit AcrB
MTKEELQKELNKKALKIQKIKDRVRPIVNKLVAPHLKEYDEVEQVNIIGNQDEVTVTIVNRLDAFKKSYKK